VWPVPRPMMQRPGASRLIVAMPFATAGACRNAGTLTPRAERDGASRLGGQREHGPAVGADHRTVRDPDVAVAEVLACTM
jgi:hypothetical protein